MKDHGRLELVAFIIRIETDVSNDPDDLERLVRRSFNGGKLCRCRVTTLGIPQTGADR